MVESTDPRDLAADSEGEGYIDPARAFTIGIAGLVIAAFSWFIEIGASIAEGLGQIISVMESVRDFGMAMFDEPANILEAGSTASQEALADFGIEGFVLSIIVIAVGFMVWVWLNPELPLIGRLIPWRGN